MFATVSLVGIISEAQFSGSMHYDDLRLLIVKTLDLDPLWDMLKPHLPRDTISLQQVVRTLNQLCLTDGMPVLMCGRSLIQNSRIITSAAYLIATGRLAKDVIRSIVTEFSLLERCDSNKVFRLTAANVLTVLRATGYAMSEKLIDLWVKQTASKRLFKDKLMLSEFFFLAANATERSEVLKKVLPYERSTESSKRTGLFTIDKSTKAPQNPNILIQATLDSQFDQSRIIIDSSYASMDYAQKRKRRIKRYLSQNNSTDESLEEFKSLLRDKDLEQSTRTAVRESDAKMRRRNTSLVAQAYAELRRVLGSQQMQSHPTARTSAAKRHVRKAAK